MTIYRDDLERVYALIERPENWCQRRYATDAAGAPVAEDSPQACRWCLNGAFYRLFAFGTPTYDEKCKALGLDGGSIAGWNDESGRTHSEVLALLRAAIERAPVREVAT